MKETFNEIIKLYKPSKFVLNYFNKQEKSWEDTLKNNNIVNISAIIFSDLHSNFTNKEPDFINHIEKKNKLFNIKL